MTDEFLRYSCQMALPGFSESAQRLLQNSRVLVAGAGGLGCPAAQYLAAAGVGTLTIADFDTIAIDNLHRQVLFGPADVGKKKAVVACERLQQQNPGIKITALDERISPENAIDIIGHYDIVVDCTDNFDTRYLINDAAVIAHKPVVYGAIYQFEGQVAVWNLKNENGTYSPNYRDVFPKVDASRIPNCAVGGVIPTLAGIIGCMQANEVIKYITKTGEILAGKLLTFDAQTMQTHIIRIGNTTRTQIKSLAPIVTAPTISAEELKKGLADNSIELIDVRTAQERDNFHIGGKHVPAEKVLAHFDKENPHKKTVLYCSSGKRSAEAVKKIKHKHPQANVYSLEGGLKEWMELSG
jgi:sulfur-carrier protein adenylyltransferase/sulfurtransferase